MSKKLTYSNKLESLKLKQEVLAIEIQKFESLIEQIDLQEKLNAALAKQKEFNQNLAPESPKQETAVSTEETLV